MGIIYRENKGSPLTVQEIDNNFRYLDERLTAVESGIGQSSEGISHIEQDGTVIRFIGTSGSVLGEVDIPSGINYTGDWVSQKSYKKGDVIFYQNSSFVAAVAHTSGDDFIADVDATKWYPLAYGSATTDDPNGGGGDPYGGRLSTNFFIEQGDPSQFFNNGEEVLNGDTYLNTETGNLWEYNGLEWIFVLSLISSHNGNSSAFETTLNSSNMNNITATNVREALEQIDDIIDNLGEYHRMDGGTF